MIQTQQRRDKFAIMIIPPAEIMDMPLRPFITSFLLAISLTAQAATEVLPLQHRTSAELLPTAQSFLGKDGTVSTTFLLRPCCSNQAFADPLKLGTPGDTTTKSCDTSVDSGSAPPSA